MFIKILDRIVGSAYFSRDEVDTLMFSEFRFGSIWFSSVIFITVNSIDHYTEKPIVVKKKIGTCF